MLSIKFQLFDPIELSWTTDMCKWITRNDHALASMEHIAIEEILLYKTITNVSCSLQKQPHMLNCTCTRPWHLSNVVNNKKIHTTDRCTVSTYTHMYIQISIIAHGSIHMQYHRVLKPPSHSDNVSLSRERERTCHVLIPGMRSNLRCNPNPTKYNSWSCHLQL